MYLSFNQGHRSSLVRRLTTIEMDLLVKRMVDVVESRKFFQGGPSTRGLCMVDKKLLKDLHWELYRMQETTWGFEHTDRQTSIECVTPEEGALKAEAHGV